MYMKDRRPHPNKLFYGIWQGFNANIGSLWLFSQQITKMADQLDLEKVHEVSAQLAPLFGDDPKDVETELLEFLPSLDDLEIYPNFLENPNVRETFQFFQTSEFKKHTLEWASQQPDKAHKLADIYATYLAEPPANGILLRRSALVSLVGFLELLLENLFFAYFYYTNLNLDINSDAHKKQAQKRADKAMRTKRGWSERIENFQKLGIQLGTAQNYVDELLEIVHRRNLIVHNNGLVDEGYMQFAPEKFRPRGAEIGKVLIVSTRYLLRAFSVVTVFGFALSQACWRQWTPGRNLKKANQTVESLVYATLKQERYELIRELAGICINIQLPSRQEQFVQVNLAIAQRELGNVDDMHQIISALSRSNPEWRVKIALAVLQGDNSKTQLLLSRARRQNNLVQISKYWPLFKHVQNESWFLNIFGEPRYHQVPKTD